MLNSYIYTIICFILLSHSIFAQEEIAIVTKKNGDVKYKGDSATLFKNKVDPGMELYNNDLLVTGNNGFVMFAYLDDGSLVKVHKDSKAYVNGNLNNRIIRKKIIIDDGFFKFNIKEQKENEFKVVTPTSVASVKGTIFYLDSDNKQDVFYGLDGIVEVLNIESNEILNLTERKKITSSTDGTITVEEIDEEDILYIQQIQLESGVEVEEIEDFDTEGSGSLDEPESGTVQELVINFTNPSGENKKLIIKFTQE